MLVLSRKKNESIVINGNITVTVVDIRDDKVRLGIVAPKETSFHRREVYEAIHGHTLPDPSAVVEEQPLGVPELLALPEAVRAIVREFDRQIKLLERDKATAASAENFLEAAQLRDHICKLMQARENVTGLFR
jgi:carbon storage regulator